MKPEKDKLHKWNKDSLMGDLCKEQKNQKRSLNERRNIRRRMGGDNQLFFLV
jgi:hypothetical protein